MKKLFSLFLACVFAAALLGACGPGTAIAKGFEDYKEFKETFTDMFMYPSYFPDGYNFLKGEVPFDATAYYIDMGSYFISAPQTADNFSRCEIDITELRPTGFGAWETVNVQLTFPMEESPRQLEEKMEQNPVEYVQVEHERYTVYQRTGNIDKEPPEGYTYERVYAYGDFYFFLSDGPYTCSFSARRILEGVTWEEDAADRAALNVYFWEEAVKIIDSLKPYGG